MGRLKAFRHLVILANLLMLGGTAWAEVRKVPKATLAHYDA